jgi:hypothetical protein
VSHCIGVNGVPETPGIFSLQWYLLSRIARWGGVLTAEASDTFRMALMRRVSRIMKHDFPWLSIMPHVTKVSQSRTVKEQASSRTKGGTRQAMSCSANRDYICVRRSLRSYCNLLSVNDEVFPRRLCTQCTQYLAETLTWELTVLYGEVYL